MDKFLKRKSISGSSGTQANDNQTDIQSSAKQRHIGINLAELPADPGLRTRISDYHPNEQDQIRRAYMQKGPFQPRDHNFPQKKFGNKMRRFNPSWFEEYPTWLEYSIVKDAAFCLCCYLFRSNSKDLATGDSFVVEGFSNWKKKERFDTHVEGPNSVHIQAWMNCEALMNQNQHIQTVICKHTDQVKKEYRARLSTSVDCIRFLLRQGLAFRGHDESTDSNNQGNFLELLRFVADHNEDIKSVVLQHAPENMKLIAPDIQKDIVNAAAVETINQIINELGDELFSILVDESRDVSTKEQMAVVLRYVNKKGQIIERFLSIVHVTDTSALSLKKAIELLFSRHGLSISRLRGQGYDGASNMRGEFNGLKTLIMNENKSAYYVHCFSHQLQLALVAVAKNHIQIALFFNQVACVVNVVGASCKRRDVLREKQAAAIIEALENNELSSGQGLNQETSLKRAGDTRCGSHYGALINLITMFSSVIDVLEFVMEDASSTEQKAEAYNLMGTMLSFEFIFSLHLMKNILGITNELSQALQRKEQDIVNAMCLVKISKQRLQLMQDDGWNSLLSEVSSFYEKHHIEVLNMDEFFVLRGRSRRKTHSVTNLHHYQVELFCEVVDMQLQELNNRFTEASTELLICISCLNPCDSFSAFDKQKLIKLAQFYPSDFSAVDLVALDNQLETYIIDMHSNSQFSELNGISDLAEKMTETKKDKLYPLVYSLLKLALVLPVATATVERAFSAMKIIKNRLRNRMGDRWMNDSLITFIEKEIFDTVDNEAIMHRFQNMKTRRGQL